MKSIVNNLLKNCDVKLEMVLSCGKSMNDMDSM